MNVRVHKWWTEEKLWELVLSFHHAKHGVQTQDLRLGVLSLLMET